MHLRVGVQNMCVCMCIDMCMCLCIDFGDLAANVAVMLDIAPVDVSLMQACV